MEKIVSKIVKGKKKAKKQPSEQAKKQTSEQAKKQPPKKAKKQPPAVSEAALAGSTATPSSRSVSDQSSSSNAPKISRPTSSTSESSTTPAYGQCSSEGSQPTDISSISAEVTSSRTQNPERLPKETGESLTSSPSSLPLDSEPASPSTEYPGTGPLPAKIRATAANSRSDQSSLVDSAENWSPTTSGPMEFREPLLSTGSDPSLSTYSAPSQSSPSEVQYSRLPSMETTPSSEASDAPLLGKMATLGDQSSSKRPSLGLSGKTSCQLAAILGQRRTEQSDDVFAGPSEDWSRHGESGSSTFSTGSSGEQQEHEAIRFLITAIMGVVDQAGLSISEDEAIDDFRQYCEPRTEEPLAELWASWKKHIVKKCSESKK